MSETLSETRPEPESVQPTLEQPIRADDPALAQTRAQLQATAKSASAGAAGSRVTAPTKQRLRH